MKKLDFTPLNEQEVTELLKVVVSVDENFKGFRVSKWFDKKKGEILYGIEINDQRIGWLNMSYGQRPVILSDERFAKSVCRSLKKLLINSTPSK